jgi:hypothetical protein
MPKLLERLWARVRGKQAPPQPEKDWKTVGETFRPSGGFGAGSSAPQNYVPPADEGRPPH